MATDYRTNNYKMEITQLKLKVNRLEREIRNIKSTLENGNLHVPKEEKTKPKKILRFSSPYASFDDSFSIARSEEADIFIWNGKEYHTKNYEEEYKRIKKFTNFTVEYRS